jgi:NADPH-dependent curcumin reductase CurA
METNSNKQTQRVALAARPKGRPQRSDFEIDTVALPPPAAGEVAVQVRYLSVDPMLALLMGPKPLGGAAPSIPLGSTIPGAATGVVIASNDLRFAPGDAVEGRLGWQQQAIVPATILRKIDPALMVESLGVLGLPGFTAWVGLRLVGDLAGRTVLISGASGAVGSVAGQLARRAGARVVGIAGDARKCRHLVERLGFSAAVDRSAADFGSRLASACEGGADVYFDNVGGGLFFTAMPAMRRGATVLICGLMSEYADQVEQGSRTAVLTEVMARGLRLIGFSNRDHLAEFPAFEAELVPIVKAGRVVIEHDLRHGLEGAVEHMATLFEGAAGGKRLVSLA